MISSSTNAGTALTEQRSQSAAKWPLWKTFLFIIVFCGLAWTAILMLIFGALN